MCNNNVNETWNTCLITEHHGSDGHIKFFKNFVNLVSVFHRYVLKGKLGNYDLVKYGLE